MDSVVYHDSVTDGYRDAVGPLVIGSGLPDPTGEPDGQWLRTASGAAVWVATTASDIPFVPAGTIGATNVQAAIEEVAAEAIAPVASVFGRTGAVAAAASDYDASQVDFAPTGSIVATDVQAAIVEVEAEIPTSLPPSGAAGGVLDGTFPAPGLNAAVAGAGLAESSDVLSVNVDGTTIEINTDTLRVKSGVFDAAGAAAAAQAASQPLDSDLTAIAALTTTSFGRALLELANSAALLSAAGADAAGAAAAAQAASQPLDSDLTAIAALSTTSFGRALLALADAAALRAAAALGTAATSNTGDFDAAGAAAAAQAASQPLDSDLTAIAALTPTNDDVVQRKAGAWTNRSMAQLIADLAALGTTFQPLDSDLTAIAALATSSFGRGLLTLADAAALRTSAALGNVATDSYATPAIVLGSTAAAGAAASPIRSDSTIAAFDATNPTTQAFGDAAAVGTAAFAARRDHKHAMMADPFAGTTAANAIGGVFWTVVLKANDTSRDTTTSPTADPELAFTAASGGLYEFEVYVIYVSAAGGGTPDFKEGVGEDTTATRGVANHLGLSASDTVSSVNGGTATNANATFGTATTNRAATIKGWHVGNGGSFALVWAQGTSSGNATTVKAGSILRYRRLL